eukprot:Em0004g427a
MKNKKWFSCRGSPTRAKDAVYWPNMTQGYQSVLKLRSDGKAETAVKIAKRLLKRSQDTSHTRVAAVDLGTSPCQRLFGRRTRSVVPLNECEEVRALSSDRGLGEESITYKNTNTAMERFYPRYKLANQFWLRMSKLRRPSRTSLLFRYGISCYVTLSCVPFALYYLLQHLEPKRGDDLSIAISHSTLRNYVVEKYPIYPVHYLEIDSCPLKWWKEHEAKFPHLSKAAREVLAVPATSAPSERVFFPNLHKSTSATITTTTMEGGSSSRKRTETSGSTSSARDPLAIVLSTINSSQVEMRKLREEMRAAQEETAARQPSKKKERPYQFNKKGHEDQFQFNDGVVDRMDEAESHLTRAARNLADGPAKDAVEKARESVREGNNQLVHRQKLIKLADRLELGWHVVNEYETDVLADNPEDERCLENAEKAAERKVLAKARKLDAVAKLKKGFGGREKPEPGQGVVTAVPVPKPQVAPVARPSGPLYATAAEKMQMCYCHVRGYLMMGCGQGKWMKEGVGSFKLEMGSFLRNGYVLPLFAEPTAYKRANQCSAYTNSDFVHKAVSELVNGHIVEEVQEPPYTCSPLSVVENSSGKKRLVENLRHVNQFLCKRRFKYEDLRIAMMLFSPDILAAGVWPLMSNLEDPELQRLAAALPDTVLRGKADSTTKKYLGAFRRWKLWAEARQGVPSFPAQDTHIALYLQHLSESVESTSAIEEAVNALSWLHQAAGLQPVSGAPLVQAALAGLRRILAKPKVRKEPVTAEMLKSMVDSAGPEPSLSEVNGNPLIEQGKGKLREWKGRLQQDAQDAILYIRATEAMSF